MRKHTLLRQKQQCLPLRQGCSTSTYNSHGLRMPCQHMALKKSYTIMRQYIYTCIYIYTPSLKAHPLCAGPCQTRRLQARTAVPVLGVLAKERPRSASAAPAALLVPAKDEGVHVHPCAMHFTPQWILELRRYPFITCHQRWTTRLEGTYLSTFRVARRRGPFAAAVHDHRWWQCLQFSALCTNRH